jgi:hypothetical protein
MVAAVDQSFLNHISIVLTVDLVLAIGVVVTLGLSLRAALRTFVRHRPAGSAW